MGTRQSNDFEDLGAAFVSLGLWVVLIVVHLGLWLCASTAERCWRLGHLPDGGRYLGLIGLVCLPCLLVTVILVELGALTAAVWFTGLWLFSAWLALVIGEAVLGRRMARIRENDEVGGILREP